MITLKKACKRVKYLHIVKELSCLIHVNECNCNQVKTGYGI